MSDVTQSDIKELPVEYNVHTATFQGTIFQLCDIVRKTSFAIHNFLHYGHAEKVYENALLHRLRKQGLRVEKQVRITVRDEAGTILGKYKADLIVEDVLIVEVKAAKSMADEHLAQTLGYLRATDREHAMLVNFGAPKLQAKKLVLSRIERQAPAPASSRKEKSNP